MISRMPASCASSRQVQPTGRRLRQRRTSVSIGAMRFFIFVVILASAGGAQAQPYHFEDSLRGGSSGNVSGGSFGPDGWTVTGVSDRIWWALPRLQSGSAQFYVENITLAV